MFRALTLATVALLAAQLPAQAQVTTAAWASARTWCEARRAGLNSAASNRVAIGDNRNLWGAEMTDPNFSTLMVHQVAQQCPELVELNP